MRLLSINTKNWSDKEPQNKELIPTVHGVWSRALGAWTSVSLREETPEW